MVAGKDWVTMSEFEYSHDKHVLGTDWKSRVRDKEDLKITAYHEAGHTLVRSGFFAVAVDSKNSLTAP
jgi:cell division protease FtsH